MPNEEVIEGNKLIAEFMGFKFNAYPKLRHFNITQPGENDWFYGDYVLEDFNNHVLEYFKYNTSWDCLMPVVEKIEALGKGYKFKICRKRVDICEDFGTEKYVLTKKTESKIHSVWLAVVEFIKWYNQNKI